MRVVEFSKVEARGTAVYTCSGCGVSERGTWVILTVDLPDEPHNLHLVSHLLQREVDKVSNTHMPVGWSGYGLSVHACPRCAK